jgi:hypothetical protein
LDRKLYGLRYKIECGFRSLKRFRAVATRHDKSATNFLATVHVACFLAWLNWGHPLVDQPTSGPFRRLRERAEGPPPRAR